jgi:hypothetical protein
MGLVFEKAFKEVGYFFVLYKILLSGMVHGFSFGMICGVCGDPYLKDGFPELCWNTTYRTALVSFYLCGEHIWNLMVQP